MNCPKCNYERKKQGYPNQTKDMKFCTECGYDYE